MHKYNPPVDFEPLAGWLCHRRLPSRLRFPWNLQRVSRTMFIKTAKAMLTHGTMGPWDKPTTK